MSISPDGRWLYASDSFSASVYVIDLKTNSVVSQINVGSNSYETCFSPDGTTVYASIAGNNDVAVISTATQRVIKTIPVGVDPNGLAITSDGTTLYVANNGSSNVSVINTKTNQVISNISVGLLPRGLSLTPDDTRLYVSNLDNNAPGHQDYESVINTQTNSVITTIALPSGSWNSNVSLDGQFVYITLASVNEVAIVSTITNAIIATVQVGNHPISIGHFIIGCKQKTLTLNIEPSPPAVITESGQLAGLQTVYGTPSNSSTFVVLGTSVQNGISITPPPGFEISDDNNNFKSKVIVGLNGTIASTTIYIRLAATSSVGSYSGDIIIGSSAGKSISVPVPLSTVTPAPLTITAQNITKKYGQALANQSVSTAFTADGLLNNDAINSINISYGNGASAISSPGTYPGTVTASAPLGNQFNVINYTINFESGGITVVPANLTITADNKTKSVDTQNPVLTITYSGFVNNEGPSDLSQLSEVSTTATLNSPIGTYPISVNGAASTDYSITYVQGILTVEDAVLSSILIPNAFTPNGDNINDTWNVAALSNYPQCDVSIFSRYGTLVYHSLGYSRPWDGTINGKQLPVGTYYYLIVFKAGTKGVGGPVTIIR